MKTLHIFSMAGVAELLSKELGESQVLQTIGLDNFGFGRHYGNTKYFGDALELIYYAKQIEGYYDRIIIHDYNEFINDFPKEKTYIYFHGSKLRSLDSQTLAELDGRVSGVFLSTPDLKQYYSDGIVIGQPVDLELFYNKQLSREYEWVAIQRGYQLDEITRDILYQYPKTEVRDRNHLMTPYRAMPVVLNEIENYVDIKHDYSVPPKIVDQYSITGLQALACGCRVHITNHRVLEKTLLKEHDSKIIAERFRKCLEH